MASVFKEAVSNAMFKLQQTVFKMSSEVKSIVRIIGTENESNESKKTFYLLSLMLLFSLILLSPDKIPQAFSPSQAETGVFEKAQEITKIIKKLVSNIV